jgi:thiol:disulfide interchange protein DsbC
MAESLNFSAARAVGNLAQDRGNRMNRNFSRTAALGLTFAVASACAQSHTGVAAKGAGAVAPARGAVAAAPATQAVALSPGDAAVKAAVQKAVPNATIDSIKPSVIPGYREVAIGGKVVYVSNDGRYLMQGALIDLNTRDNLTEVSEGALRRAQLDAVPRNRRIVFSPPNPKYRITVFTDVDCGYCRKLHSQINDYMKEGISVEYLFFPRAGIGSESFNKAVSVWCAADQRKALTDAKLDKPIARKTCTNPVTMDYALGQRIGIDGTPAIYAADGTQLGGYLSPTDMLARLDRAAARAAVASN